MEPCNLSLFSLSE